VTLSRGAGCRCGTLSRFELTQDFPVGLDRLWAVLGRPDYIRDKYRSLGSTSLRILKFSADAGSNWPRDTHA
jgi:hypothetical protein